MKQVLSALFILCSLGLKAQLMDNGVNIAEVQEDFIKVKLNVMTSQKSQDVKTFFVGTWGIDAEDKREEAAGIDIKTAEETFLRQFSKHQLIDGTKRPIKDEEALLSKMAQANYELDSKEMVEILTLKSYVSTTIVYNFKKKK